VPGKLVLVRHGQSIWNVENLFTGWHDVDLSPQGRLEAATAGRELLREGIAVDIAFTSMLKRAIRTLCIMLDEMDRMWIPVERSWRLNERHYGALQGLNKAETVAQHGEAQVKIWRRSYDIPPPALEASDPRHPRFDVRYSGIDPARDRIFERYAGEGSTFLGITHRARTTRGTQRARRCTRQQPARHGQNARWCSGERNRRTEHPDRRSAFIRSR
jgi:bisphosphoglycerate-dependent phosphoglycerate mutase family 1